MHDQRQRRHSYAGGCGKPRHGDPHRHDRRGQYSRAAGRATLAAIAATAVTGTYNLIGTGGSGGLTNGGRRQHRPDQPRRPGPGPAGRLRRADPDHGAAPRQPGHRRGHRRLPGHDHPITTDQRGFPLDSPDPDIGAFQSDFAGPRHVHGQPATIDTGWASSHVRLDLG